MLFRSIVTLVLLLRNKSHLNVRQPLSRVLLVVGSGIDQSVVESVRDIILDEINVRSIEYIEDSSEVVKRSAKANFKQLGSRLGIRMKGTAAAIGAFGEAEMSELLTSGSLPIDVDGEAIVLAPDAVALWRQELRDWGVAKDGNRTVPLDAHRQRRLSTT